MEQEELEELQEEIRQILEPEVDDPDDGPIQFPPVPGGILSVQESLRIF